MIKILILLANIIPILSSAHTQTDWWHTETQPLIGNRVTCAEIEAFGINGSGDNATPLGIARAKWSQTTVSTASEIMMFCAKRKYKEIPIVNKPAFIEPTRPTQNNSLTRSDYVSYASKLTRAVQSHGNIIVTQNRDALLQTERERADARRVANQVATTKINEERAAIAELKRQEQTAQDEKRKATIEAEKDKRNLAEACKKTKRYELFEAQQGVIESLATIVEAKGSLANERNITQSSGVVNKSAMYNLSAMLIRGQQNLTIAYQDYKKLGGKATSPQKVESTAIDDPC